MMSNHIEQLKASPEVMPGQAPDEPTLEAPAVQGTKRKASLTGDIDPSEKGSRSCPSIKLEPGALNENDDAFSMGTFEAQCIPKAKLDMSSVESVPSRQEPEINTAKVSLRENECETNSLMRPSSLFDHPPPPSWQKASRRPNAQSRPSGDTLGDVAYNSIPDYAPPTSTLPTDDPQILQVHWPQKAVVDLSHDPDRHMLHEAEIRLATSLNLSCAKYLCTKRRIFHARLKALQEGRKFKKSDSQKACKIDTNKASKIGGAFEKVGWFDEKYFLGYLDESSNTLSKNHEAAKDGGSSSELSEIDIWNVSESEFRFTSEGDESTDEDTADSDGGHHKTQGREYLKPSVEPFSRKQDYDFPLIGEDATRRRFRNDKIIRISDTFPKNDTVDMGSVTEGRRSTRGLLLGKTLYPWTPASPSADNDEESPVLETRSMTQKLKFAQNSPSDDKSVSLSTIEAGDSQQKSSSKSSYRLPAPTTQFALRHAIPNSLDEANAADVMLVEMKEKGRSWLEIAEAWERQTGRAKTRKSLSHRHGRIMESLARTQLKADGKLDKGPSPTYSRPEPAYASDNSSSSYPHFGPSTQDLVLLAAEAEVEKNFQSQKAYMLAEIENKFQSEKWDLVAKAMSRAGRGIHSADSVQAQYERLTKHLKAAVAKDEINRDGLTDLPQQTPHAVGREKSEPSTLSRSGAKRLDEASNAINSPTDGSEHGHQTVRKSGPQNHAEHSARMRKVWANRRALGTNGRDGGPPKASKSAKRVKMAFPTTKPKAATSPALASGDTPSFLPNREQPIALGEMVGRDANQHKHWLAQIIPDATVADS